MALHANAFLNFLQKQISNILPTKHIHLISFQFPMILESSILIGKKNCTENYEKLIDKWTRNNKKNEIPVTVANPLISNCET